MLAQGYLSGQVDSLEFSETPEIMEMTQNDQILNQIKRNINKLRLGEISLQQAVRIEFSVDFAFSNMLYGKNENLEMP